MSLRNRKTSANETNPSKCVSFSFSAVVTVLCLGASGAALCAGCGPDKPAPQPQPSVAHLEVLRAPVTIIRKGNKAQAVSTQIRLEPGTKVTTGKWARALVELDLGATLLLDKQTTVLVEKQGVRLLQGRVFADSRGELTLQTAQGPVRAVKASFDAQTGRNAVKVYCASGEITYEKPKTKPKAPPAEKNAQTGRLSSGMTLVLQPGGPELMPEALWEDWTAGLARVGPRRPAPPAGIGRMHGRRSSSLGRAPTPLITRMHDVKVKLDGDMAITTVTQTFFNPHSYAVKGFYSVRLPKDAIIDSFLAGDSEDSLVEAKLISRYRRAKRHYVPNVLLEWAGNNEYEGRITSIEAGKTYVVQMIYVQWLEVRPQRRIYVYPMGGGRAPMLGEFSLEVDIQKTDARKIQASLGAKRRGNKILLRKSDFRPPADFVLELLKRTDENAKARAYRAAAKDKKVADTLYLVLDPPLPPPPKSFALAVIADLSAGTSPTEAKLVKDTVDAILRQLKKDDRVAVLVTDLDAQPLGGKPTLGPATAKRKQRILSKLARWSPAGASDLGGALEKAATLLDSGRGIVVYVGDGQPTSGSLLPGPIKDRLSRQRVYPRIFSVGVGSDANMEFLTDIVGNEGAALKIENKPQAARVVFRILSLAGRPCLRAVRVETDTPLERLYPSRPFTVVAGQQIRVTGRSRAKLPKKVTIRGLKDGKHFKKTYQVKAREVMDRGDLKRRWALARIEELLQRGEGREAVADLGMRYDVLTPWTALAIGSVSGYTTQLIKPQPGVYRVEDLLNESGIPAGRTRIAFEPRWLHKTTTQPSWQHLYRNALRSKSEPVRVCFERKAAGHPELSGRVDVKLELRADGTIKKVDQVYSSLNDSEVEACIKRALEALRLPQPPPGAPTIFTHTYRFSSPDSRYTTGGKCSAASRKYLSTRRALWRERLSRRRSVSGAMAVWRKAYRQCELRTWLDRKALLDLMLKYVGRTANQVRLYHEFDGRPSLQNYLRRQILRRVRTRADVEAARRGLNLEGHVDWELLKKGLEKTKTTGEKITLVKKFLALSPHSVRLRSLLLRLLEKAKRTAEADDLAAGLRNDPAADMAVRRQIGEIYLRRGQRKEARRAFSEIVEGAPFDPWARRYLGHLYLAHDWCLDAHREYENLAWLLPHDQKVPLLVAQAAACSKRTDEALRLQAKVSESAEAGPGRSGPAAAARVLTSLLLARLRTAAEKTNDRAQIRLLQARARRLGLMSWAGKLLIAVQWTNRHQNLQVGYTKPGDDRLLALPIASSQLGLAALRQKRQLDGDYKIEVRLASNQLERSDTVEARLTILLDEASAKQKLVTRKLVFKPETKALAFKLNGAVLEKTEPKKKEKKPEPPTTP
jgi:tetratricopeptide (TPR) repeat protein